MNADTPTSSNHGVVVTSILPTVNARIYPRGSLGVWSRTEVARLCDASSGGMHELLRSCADVQWK